MVETLETPWHVIGASFVFFGGWLLLVFSCSVFGVGFKRASVLYLWHTFFCLIYFWLSLYNVADATAYYLDARTGRCDFSLGTAAVRSLTCVLIQVDLSYLGCFLVFNLFGAFGVIAFDGALTSVVQNTSRRLRKLSTLLVLLPSVSYWSSSIGKDALAFMAASFALWSLLKIEKRTVLMSVSISIMLVVRPHIAAMLLLTFVVAVVFGGSVRPLSRIMLSIAAIVGSAIILPIALTYVGFDKTDVLMDYVELAQAKNLGGGSSLDISSMSFPVQLFTYLFRPLPYEAHNLFSLAVSFENLLLLLLSLYAFGKAWVFHKSKDFSVSQNHYKGYMPRSVYYSLCSYVLFCWPIMASTTSNLGIAARQKWMFLPFVILLLVYSLSNKKAISIS